MTLHNLAKDTDDSKYLNASTEIKRHEVRNLVQEWSHNRDDIGFSNVLH